MENLSNFVFFFYLHLPSNSKIYNMTHDNRRKKSTLTMAMRTVHRSTYVALVGISFHINEKFSQESKPSTYEINHIIGTVHLNLIFFLPNSLYHWPNDIVYRVIFLFNFNGECLWTILENVFLRSFVLSCAMPCLHSSSYVSRIKTQFTWITSFFGTRVNVYNKNFLFFFFQKRNFLILL